MGREYIRFPHTIAPMDQTVTGGGTALASDLYVTLAWQTLVLAIIVAVVVWRWRGRLSTAAAVDVGSMIDEVLVESTGRRVLRVSLGVLWIVDGLLQMQPQMPASFVQRVIAPALDVSPDWLYPLVAPVARLWLQHPVAADAITVWIQLGLGIAILVGGFGRFARIALYASIAWALFVWSFGELLGGLTDTSASWLNGAPGAALLYIAASALLLLPLSTWDSGVAPHWAQRCVGATMLIGAALQALPRAGYWTATGLSDSFAEIAARGVPAPLAAPIQWLATAVPAHAVLANACLVAITAILGVTLIIGAFPRSATVAAGLVCLLAWWLGQGFGIFGGTGTDPNTGLILLVLLAASWPWPLAKAPALSPVSSAEPAAPQTWSGGVRVAAGALAFGAVAVLPVIAGVGFLGPQTAQAAIGDSGGLVETSPDAAPNFILTDQSGLPISMRDLRGKLTLVAFLDPECLDSCPIMANQLATAVRDLGASGSSIAILAVDVNPSFNSVEDVRTFTKSHGLQDLPGWHFVTGSNREVSDVLAAFGEGITVPRVGMIGHPQTVYLFGRDGTELAVLNDTANENLTQSYVQLITSELRRRL